LKEEYFSLIVPTYNEYDNIEELISIVGNVLNLNNIKYEILICDDNSPDKTWEKVSDISKKDPRVKLIRRFRNKGLTPAVLEGMERSEGSILGVMDADLQHDVSILPRMIELTKQYDLIIASRYLEKYCKFTFTI
jgi:dolichol-phosphate mannosyltransferase